MRGVHGFVFDDCTANPIEGIKVCAFNHSTNRNDCTVTDSDGKYHIPIYTSGIWITVTTNNQSENIFNYPGFAFVNFDIVSPVDYMRVVNCATGESKLIYSTDFSTRPTIISCEKWDLKFDTDYNQYGPYDYFYTVRSFFPWGGNTVLRQWSIGCDNPNNPPESINCAGIDLTEKLRGLPNAVYQITLVKACCDRGDGDFPRQITSGLVTWQNSESPVVDFKFLASFEIEDLNGENDNNGMIDFISDSRPGPLLGDISSGFNGSFTTGNNISNYNVKIEGVNCEGQIVLETVYNENFQPDATGKLPDNFLFAANVKDANGTPLFLSKRGECFKFTLSATNACGTDSKSSYFKITESCMYCMDAPDKNPIAQQVHKIFSESNNTDIESAQGISLEFPTINDRQEVPTSIYPNPADDQLYIRSSVLQSWDIYNSSGQHILQGTDRNIHVNSLQKGLYLIDIKTVQGSKILKFVKQ